MVTGLAINDPVPGNYIQVNFAQGDSGGGITDYKAIIYGNKTSAGVGTVDSVIYGPDTATEFNTEQDAITLAGQGSEAHLLVREFKKVNKTTPLYLILVTESAGNNATGTVTLSGTASADGEVLVTIMDVVVSASFVSGDTASEIGDAIELAINSNKNLPVIASNSGGTITLTAKNKGPRGNLIRYKAKINPLTGVTTTVSPTTQQVFSGGTTADDYTTAEATVAGSSTNYYYKIVAATDDTNLDLVADSVDSESGPLIGKLQRLVYGSAETLGTATTQANTLNRARAECVFSPYNPWLPGMMAAGAAGAYSLFETDLTQPFSVNFNGFGAAGGTEPYWNVPSPEDGYILTRTQIKSALNNGLSAVDVVGPNRTALSRRVTTRSLSGSENDYRVRDSSIVTICDFFANDLKSAFNTSFAGKKIGNDLVPGETVTTGDIVRPSDVRAVIYDLLEAYEQSTLIEDVDTVGGTRDSLVVQRNSSPTTRMEVRIKLKAISILNSTATDVDEVGGNR